MKQSWKPTTKEHFSSFWTKVSFLILINDRSFDHIHPCQEGALTFSPIIQHTNLKACNTNEASHWTNYSRHFWLFTGLYSGVWPCYLSLFACRQHPQAECSQTSFSFFSFFFSFYRCGNWKCLSLWPRACTQTPLQPGGMRASTDSPVWTLRPLPRPRHQAAAEFSLFSERLLLLGWSSPCVGPQYV